MKKLAMLAALMTAVAVLDGCSAGGKQTTTTTTTPPVATPTASDLIVTVTTPSNGGLQDTGAQVATVTVTAVDANRNVVATVPVSIVPDSTAVVTTSGTTTSAAGVVTGSVGIGNDHSNRTVAVVVTSGTISKTVSFQVIGATLTATLNPAVVTPGASASISYHLSDAAGSPLAGVNVALSGGLTGNGPTDANGNFVFPYTAPATEQVLTVTATADNATASSTITDTSGSIPAAVGAVQSYSLTADPATVSVNAEGSTTNQVDVRAVFLGASNQPIPNVRVRFDLDGDPSGIGGTLASGTGYVYSDADGVARTTYTPGTRSSGSQKLVIRGCWSNSDFDAVTDGAACPNAKPITSAITVAGASVSLAIDTDNTITPLTTAPVIYQIAYAVQVVDSAHNPVPGVTVSSSVDLPTYYKGTFKVLNGAYVLASQPQACGNEDVNRNGNIDVFNNTTPGTSEDVNQSGALEPAAAAVSIVAQTQTANLLAGQAVTDQFGRAYFFLQYGTGYAFWEDVVLNFSAVVSGSEGHKSKDIGQLPFPTGLLSNTEIALPFFASPWGTDTTSGFASVTDPATNITYSLCTESPTNVKPAAAQAGTAH